MGPSVKFVSAIIDAFSVNISMAEEAQTENAGVGVWMHHMTTASKKQNWLNWCCTGLV